MISVIRIVSGTIIGTLMASVILNKVTKKFPNVFIGDIEIRIINKSGESERKNNLKED